MFKKILFWLYRVLQGALIGVGSILPGVSGGVLCVMFGIYRPIMELFTHPFKALKKHIFLFIPIGIGGVLGFFGLAKLVEYFFETSPQYMVCLFFGLIAGTIPSLYKEAGLQGRTKGSYVAMIASFIGLTVFLILMETLTSMSITPNIWWYFFCGVIWGLSLIVPGLSSSSILIFIGLYQPMTSGIANFALDVIIPLGVGIVASALALARGVNTLYEKKYSIISHIVIGLVSASAIMIVPRSYNGIVEILVCIVCAAVGFAAAMGMDKLGVIINKKNENEEAKATNE
ncbi:MAG: DUF368 domain-containing protein [Clostridiales bacterium]|nr:DUF368 domain-containing protein [Clostridiales bacterium]